jgi:hypothetical protein
MKFHVWKNKVLFPSNGIQSIEWVHNFYGWT